jgi:hypothetical protein
MTGIERLPCQQQRDQDQPHKETAKDQDEDQTPLSDWKTL